MEKVSRAHLKVISRNDIIATNGRDDIIKGEGPEWRGRGAGEGRRLTTEVKEGISQKFLCTWKSLIY